MRNLFSRRRWVFLFAVICMALWGSLFPCVKLGYAAFEIDTSYIPNILLFAGLRFLVCGIIIFFISLISDKKVTPVTKNNIAPIIIIAVTAIVLHYAFTYIGLSMNDGSKTAILKQVGSLFIICFAFIFNKEDAFTWKKCIGGLLGFASIAVINLEGLKLTFNFGDILIIAASFCLVAASIASKKAYANYSPVAITAYSQFSGGLILATAGWLSGGRIRKVDPDAIHIFAYICIASIVAYILWNVLLKYNDLSELYIIKFFESLFAVAFSGLLISENIWKSTYLISFVLVCLGIIICSKNRTRDFSKASKTVRPLHK